MTLHNRDCFDYFNHFAVLQTVEAMNRSASLVEARIAVDLLGNVSRGPSATSESNVGFGFRVEDEKSLHLVGIPRFALGLRAYEALVLLLHYIPLERSVK